MDGYFHILKKINKLFLVSNNATKTLAIEFYLDSYIIDQTVSK